jgi:hypothetical protein
VIRNARSPRTSSGGRNSTARCDTSIGSGTASPSWTFNTASSSRGRSPGCASSSRTSAMCVASGVRAGSSGRAP